MKRSITIIFNTALLLSLIAGAGAAQAPYNLNFGREALVIGAGGASLVGGVLLKDQTALFTPDELARLDPSQVNSFDRGAIDNVSRHAREASDYFLNGSHVFPLLFLANQDTRRDFGKIAFLWGETLMLNGGLTFASKYAFRRPRPFVYNREIDVQYKMTVSAKTAFFSGHTSMTAANTFFAAKVFSDYFPESGWKPVVWSTAVVIPAITGYLRVRAGRHYPSDVIVGYATGALLGYFIPHLHKRPGLKDKGLELHGGLNGALLRLTF